MKEYPILFNAAMVRAIQYDTKTETRRTKGLEAVNRNPDEWKFEKIAYHPKLGVQALFHNEEGVVGSYGFKFPLGKIGDVLWVRETFFLNGDDYIYLADGTCCEQFEQCECCDVGKPKWKPSIHMPKEAARIFLEITNIKVERLQDISEESAINEGIQQLERWPEAPDKPRYKYYGIDSVNFPRESAVFDPHNYQRESAVFDPTVSFFTLWAEINGEDSVIRNPWVWVIFFKRMERKEDVLP